MAIRMLAKRRELADKSWPDGRTAVLEYIVTPSRLAGGVTDAGRQLPDTFIATLTFVDVSRGALGGGAHRLPRELRYA